MGSIAPSAEEGEKRGGSNVIDSKDIGASDGCGLGVGGDGAATGSGVAADEPAERSGTEHGGSSGTPGVSGGVGGGISAGSGVGAGVVGKIKVGDGREGGGNEVVVAENDSSGEAPVYGRIFPLTKLSVAEQSHISLCLNGLI